METLGMALAVARKNQKLLIRDVAAKIGIDAALVSRFESGKRIPTKVQIEKFASLLQIDRESLLVLWLSEKLMQEAGKGEIALKALVLAEERVQYGLSKNKPITNPDLIAVLQKIDALKITLDALRKYDSYRIAEALEIEYTFESNRIEGNTLTLQETALVVNNGLTISGKSMREHLEAINHYEAIAFVKELVGNQSLISERELLQIHQLVLRGIDKENAGFYRQIQVRISGSNHIPPEPWQVPIKMEELFLWFYENQHLHPVILAAEMHERLVSIHPFIDGNGRTSRLLMNLILLKKGYVIANLSGDKNARHIYFDCLEKAREDMKESFIHFIAAIEVDCLSKYIGILKPS